MSIASRPAYHSWLVCLVCIALVACDDGVAPTPPARLEVSAGDAQSAVVGTALAVEPAVRVLAADGSPLARVRVEFSITGGGGSVARTRASTDSDGIARAGAWTLGTRSGTNTLGASVRGVTAVTFSATGTAGPPTTIAAVGGTTVQGTVGTAVAAPTVRVSDRHDNPVGDVTVLFAVTAGGGSLPNQNVTTGADGVASAGTWTLGGAAGTQTVTASSAAIAGSSVVFTASASPAAASRLIVRVQPPQTAASGAALSLPPVIQVADAFGNAVASAGVVVTASAPPALVLNLTATTDGTGAATFNGLTLIGTVGNYAIRFSAPALNAVVASTIALGPGAASRLSIANAMPSIVLSGIVFSAQPVIEVQDDAGNRVPGASHAVTASLESSSGVLRGTLTVNAVQGRASFTDLAYEGAGPFQLRFAAQGLHAVITAPVAVQVVGACTGGAALPLDFTLGQSVRYRLDAVAAPRCLQFDTARNRDQQYLVMLENMPASGSYSSALFPGSVDNAGIVTVTVGASTLMTSPIAASRRARLAQQLQLPPGMSHAWDFGQGRIYEYSPPEPPGGVPQPMLLRSGQRIAINSTSAAPVVGDTLVVFLVGIPRLGIQDGNQRAVVRLVSNELIIAEDVRLNTLLRASGAANTPLTQADMDSIARAYAAHPRAQGDLLFNGRHNQATELEQPARIVAVHTLMPADNIWGYTFASTNVFVWDFWVSSDGSTRGFAQHPLRNAHNLFMHEVAHMRHRGVMERANRAQQWGNQWLIEGFARFSERLPTASYLLNQADPSRTGNATLGRYAEYTVRFYDDVPTYLFTSASMLGGYQSSSYVFDYLADQVALAGGDWRSAINQFLLGGGTESELNAAISTVLPGLTFQELFTRARLALYLDDIGTAGLPGWTQYLQYNLRGSREPSSNAAFDPRNAWPRITPGTAFGEARLLPPGSAFGYLIDGTTATASTNVTFDFQSPVNGVLSVTRIR